MSLKVFIVRHGDALFNTNIDSERKLSALGKKQAQEAGFNIVKALEKLFLSKIDSNVKVNIRFEVSPYIRAQETFEFIKNEIQKVDFINVCEVNLNTNIVPSGNYSFEADSLIYCDDFNDIDVIIYVSHMPFVSYFCYSLGGKKNEGFRNCEVVVLERSLNNIETETFSIINDF